MSRQQSDNLALWLDSETAKDFRKVIETLIAADAAKLAENHCSNAEEFLRSQSNSQEFKDAQRRMARFAIALKVFDEIGELAVKRSSKNAEAFEILTAIKLA